ncbi:MULTISPECIES: phosphate signaling complex protein PhoU [Dethiosulfovibrio]|uniref:Phosphate signaling complex protein PhoU n=2 Tax=Dethiosulfovibrio TaxID=47054 RepID=A0ABS9ENY0_9BACT|nr:MULTISPECIES: phosphate signaling complex protein PhoU [Dethiosulfovibrio]MCF4114437.1 phosphate signaling complex protein PhoU [Dethiosulfovibrio russensis]MCF4142902.1 phosphate signaling complex protein PhoU [Dethiosulfovibrio marinus]MCF4144999.1 phosphate signaling complex protein PhoU [Dethiosulfovibrio acidaminovorans]
MLKWFATMMNKSRSDGGRRDVSYGDDRERILSLVRLMGDEVCIALSDSLISLKEGNVELARKVIDRDDLIDGMETDVNRECLASIAIRKPVREDLRFVFAVLKIATDLERIGDQAVNVAERALTVSKYPMLKPLVDISKMTEISINMVRKALRSFFDRDTDLAVHVFREDKQLDRIAGALSEELIEMMAEMDKGDKDGITVATELLLTARHLERVGDHASNVSERVFFMVRGERLKEVILGKVPETAREELLTKNLRGLTDINDIR